MADDLSLILWSLAEYFNYTAVALILLCSTLMTVFIIRLNGEHWGRYHHGASQAGLPLAYEKDMTEYINPFFLKLSPSAASNLSDGVLLEMSCLMLCEVHVFWGVSINPLHTALLKEGTDFLNDVLSDTLLHDHCLASEKHRVDAGRKQQLHLLTPEELSTESLGTMPRQRYPCVVVMAATDSSCIVDHTDVVAMVTIIHLKDTQVRMATHIIAQYAKMAGQAVFNLQPLFFASQEEEDSSSTDVPVAQQTGRHQENQQTSESTAGDPHTHCRQVEDRDSETSSSADNRRTARAVSEAADQRCVCNTTGTQGARSTVGTNICHSRDTALEAYGDYDGDLGVSHSSYQRWEWRSEAVFPECIVCQNQPLNCVLLPCRHTCVCRVCFEKLDRCPMCRSHIESFFILSDEADIPASSASVEPLPMDLYSRFERFSRRLNELLGFE